MKISHYLYNAFIIEWDDKRIAIDPGALLAYYFSFASLIPKKEWKDNTHIFVTHGDPDHYWHADRVAKASSAPFIFNKTMIRAEEGVPLMLGPRSKGLTFKTPVNKFHTLSVDETIEVDGMIIKGIKTTNGPLTIKLGPIKKTEYPGPNERVGWGAIGFEIKYSGKTVVNLGDTLLQAEEWEQIQNPDVLMIPIGGRLVENTMDENEAIEAVKIIQPKLVIPMHYNCPILFKKHYNKADDILFKQEVEKLGLECKILGKAESLIL